MSHSHIPIIFNHELFHMNIDVAASVGPPLLDIQPVLATGVHDLYAVIWQCQTMLLITLPFLFI